MPSHSAILPTPTGMIAHLDRFVRGQARAKQDLAVAVYNHYLSQAYREREGADLGRYHVLLMGPTGVGKTYLVKTLADFLGALYFSSLSNSSLRSRRKSMPCSAPASVGNRKSIREYTASSSVPSSSV